MIQYPNQTTHSITLREDTSRTELLPVKPELSTSNSYPYNNGQDIVEAQWHDRAVAIKGWPENFKTLKETRWKKTASLVIDTFVALVPLVFVGKSHMKRNNLTRSQT